MASARLLAAIYNDCVIGPVADRSAIGVFSVLNGRQKDDAAPVIDLVEDSP